VDCAGRPSGILSAKLKENAVYNLLLMVLEEFPHGVEVDWASRCRY